MQATFHRPAFSPKWRRRKSPGGTRIGACHQPTNGSASWVRDRHRDLIASIYDAELDPSLWRHCYDEMRSILGAESTLATLQAPSAGVALLACGMDTRFVREYAYEWWQKVIWAIGGISHPRGRAFIVSDIVPDAVWTRSEILALHRLAPDRMWPFALRRAEQGFNADRTRRALGWRYVFWSPSMLQ